MPGNLAAKLFERLAGFVPETQHALGVLIENASRRGGLRLAPQPVEEFFAEQLLQVAHVFAHRRLG